MNARLHSLNHILIRLFIGQVSQQNSCFCRCSLSFSRKCTNDSNRLRFYGSVKLQTILFWKVAESTLYSNAKNNSSSISGCNF